MWHLPPLLWVANLVQYQSLLFSKFEQISANVVFATLLLYFGYPRKSIFSRNQELLLEISKPIKQATRLDSSHLAVARQLKTCRPLLNFICNHLPENCHHLLRTPPIFLTK